MTAALDYGRIKRVTLALLMGFLAHDYFAADNDNPARAA